MPPSPRSVRLYGAALRGRRRWRRLSDAALSGVFLGLMDRRALAALDETFYNAATERVGDELHGYADEAYVRSGLHPWETTMVERHFPVSGRIVVIGAGAGREVLALDLRGLDALGYEPHPRLVAAAAAILPATGSGARVRVCARDTFPVIDEPVDAVMVGWAVLMLIPSRRRRVSFLSAARNALPVGAPVLLSFFTRGPSRSDQLTRAIGSLVRLVRGKEPIELGDALVPNFVHRFTREEIAEELAAAGFELVDFEAEPYGHAVGRAV